VLGAVVVLGSLAGAAGADPLLVFSGKDANYTDEFSFVALKNIANNTVIFFTNYDWDNTTGAFTTSGSEGVIQFTATATITKGSVVKVAETSPNTYTVTGNGTAVHVAGAADWAAVSQDPHYAFAASNAASPLNSVTEIYAYLDSDPVSVAGDIKDPRVGVNSSPTAIVAYLGASSPVGVDFVGNRAVAGVANLTKLAYFTTTSGVTDLVLDLTSYAGIVANAIFADGFESNSTAGWSTALP